MKIKFFYSLLLFVFFCLINSCGIEEHYYLPQLPESNIIRDLNTEAVINIPSLDSNRYYYATNYSIFYRIYISDHLTDAYIQETDLSNINSILLSDYRAFLSLTDPTDSSSIPSANTFRNRNYYELEFAGREINDILSKDSDSRIRILFPTMVGDFPVVIKDGTEIRLRRSSQLVSPVPDLFFRSTVDLRNSANATSNANADVASRSGTNQYAYVSMYIAAVGQSANLSRIYSKPTHISVFKLPDHN
ncbi:MAG: hypothetical protein LBU66_05600 [Treponema sp.]|jgi:hypothetical protein|nr:hypothetical protein [Treponema sp.]